MINAARRRRGTKRFSVGQLGIGALQLLACFLQLLRSGFQRLLRFCQLVICLLELALHFAGEDVLKSFVLNKPVLGELLAGLAGMVPNCAVSVAFAQLYAEGGMSAGALMAGSLAGSGLGLLVLFRTHRRLKDNLLILAAVYVFGVIFGHLAGYLF